jgi:hypothetical protein
MGFSAEVLNKHGKGQVEGVSVLRKHDHTGRCYRRLVEK